jgi:hypothetical protein
MAIADMAIADIAIADLETDTPVGNPCGKRERRPNRTDHTHAKEENKIATKHRDTICSFVFL